MNVESQADELEFTARQIAHNLGFVPEDKFGWKPAEGAKSVLDIVNHVAQNLTGALGLLNAGEWDSQYTPAANGVEAKKAILESMGAYAAKLRTLRPEDLEGDTPTPAGPFPKTAFIHMTVFDPIYHHGQIAYLQTLWGDGETHFDMNA
jgi:hypothetical protein